jgi:predicted alpha/beta-hydrolase family hydrolase
LKPSSELGVVVGTAATTALVYLADAGGSAALVLAHGAGAGQRSAFMTERAAGIAALGIDVVTFDFPYTAAKRRVPDRPAVLEACYLAVIDAVGGYVASARRCLFIGGKSMGGRIATQVAAADRDLAVAGIVLIGYPLHPPGQPAKLRTAHLPAVARPMLFVQGSRDTFGTPGELREALMPVSPVPALHVVTGGDHSLKVSRNPAAQAAIYDDVQRTIVAWMATVTSPAPGSR